MQVGKTNYEVNATPRFQVLTEEEIEAIYHAALTVLYETGVRVYEKEGVEVAYSGGAIVELAIQLPVRRTCGTDPNPGSVRFDEHPG